MGLHLFADVLQYHHARDITICLPIAIIPFVVLSSEARSKLHARLQLLWTDTTYFT